uniref:Uncharacterized protein n=1 Tax=Romanomermis culicivorax TaxID=13658 RepID=A0A915IQR6_ROMCU
MLVYVDQLQHVSMREF